MADDVPSRVRTACAWVAERSRSVEIAEEGIEAYAAALPAPAELPAPDPATHLVEGGRESRAAFVVCLDAINFGSGWWPTVRKRPGHSGYFTIAAGLTERFRERGPWTGDELTGLEPGEIALVLGQDPGHPLMAHYASALRDVGEHILGDHGGRFEGLLDAAGGSAVALANLLAEWEAFADVSTYDDRPVPFFKRAQIAAADLNRTGVAELGGEDRLTAFADNLVPHVFRLDGVLRLDPGLERSIDAGELLEHGSPVEVELRACAVHAIELLSAATGGHLSPAQIDAALWNRGAEPRYKSVPRPRSRNTAY
ncbi:MAG TPA: queuosine salvage family protein [Solirubrobacterales bacterium]|nr:queuosine salvage family protein [Solirubrobacterales bacterium]